LLLELLIALTFEAFEILLERESESFLAEVAVCAGSNIRAAEKFGSCVRVLTPNLASSAET
jgi:hypothetical protein